MSLLAIPIILIVLGVMLYGLGFLLAFVGWVSYRYAILFYKIGRWFVRKVVTFIRWFVRPFVPVRYDA